MLSMRRRRSGVGGAVARERARRRMRSEKKGLSMALGTCMIASMSFFFFFPMESDDVGDNIYNVALKMDCLC